MKEGIVKVYDGQELLGEVECSKVAAFGNEAGNCECWSPIDAIPEDLAQDIESASDPRAVITSSGKSATVHQPDDNDGRWAFFVSDK